MTINYDWNLGRDIEMEKKISSFMVTMLVSLQILYIVEEKFKSFTKHVQFYQIETQKKYAFRQY